MKSGNNRAHRRLVIDVSSIRDVKGAEIEQEFFERIEPVVLGERHAGFTAPVRIKTRTTNSGQCFLAQGVITAEVSLVCDRCLEPFVTVLSGSFEEGYPRGMESFIDITDAVNESLTLAIPMKTLCVSECRGLCPGCGRNLNVERCECPTHAD